MMQATFGGYDRMRPFRNDLNLSRNGIHYALMPVWQYLYHYKGQTYQYHVNGQTGKVIGKTPVSKAKVFSYAASVLAAVTAAGYMLVWALEIL